MITAVSAFLHSRSDPAFDVAIEIRGFHDWIVHEDIGKAVDAYLDGVSTPAWRHRKQPKTAAASKVSKSVDATVEDEVSKSEDAKEEDDGEVTTAPADAAAAEAEDQLEIVPLVASALPGDAWFEYCALAEGDKLPEPGDRQEVKVKFR